MNQTLPATFPAPFHPERTMRGTVPPDFERFYRENLRFRSGGRIRALQIAERYRRWALTNEAQSLSLRQIRSAMENVGHRHLHSDGIFYLDVVFAAAAPDLADNFPSAGTTWPGDLLDQVDRTILELTKLRRQVAR